MDVSAALLVVAGFAAIDHPGNREAWLWAACCLALAAPWLGHSRDEAVRLARCAAERPHSDALTDR